jgi:hypothetical protein
MDFCFWITVLKSSGRKRPGGEEKQDPYVFLPQGMSVRGKLPVREAADGKINFGCLIGLPLEKLKI